MKGKIAIVTLFGNYNYGNRLQNYAVQKMYEGFGYQTDTINFFPDRKREILRKIFKRISCMVGNPRSKRFFALDSFNRKYLHVRNIEAPNGIMPSYIEKEYDYFSVGSDQVWNPELRINQRNIFFLLFTQKAKRICISPSIGTTKIDYRYENEFTDYFNGFEYLSCRENAGTKEIERLSGRKCTTLIDPTLYLNAEEWREFEGHRYCKKKYALVFFLGDISREINEIIDTFCESNSLERIEPSCEKDSTYMVSPDEFVGLIDDASVVFTDSFHGVAFSINMNTPFYAFDRMSTCSTTGTSSSRIESILKLTGLEERFRAEKMSMECDFTHSNCVLQTERKKFKEYVEICLSQNEMRKLHG